MCRAQTLEIGSLDHGLFPSVPVEVLCNLRPHGTGQFRSPPRPVLLLPQVRTIFNRGGKGGLKRVTCPRPPGNFCSRVLGTLARSRGPLKALRLPQPRVPGPMCVDAGPYLQPLDAIAHIGLERQGEEQRLADLRPRPHPRAAGAPGGRTLGKPRRSPAARPAAVAPPARTSPAVGESGGSGLRLRAGRGPRRGGGRFIQITKEGSGPGEAGRAAGVASRPAQLGTRPASGSN